ncbi:MAG TPA: hypothetical protein VHA52_03735, partial [Candidatus Babeliaceae bacterium]|nr:hypothetical protein [Candidatus Babeliaceae bacterium]
MLVCYYNNKTEVIREISGYRRYPGIDKRNDITGSEEVPDTITHLRLNMLSLNVRESKLPYFWHGLTSRGLCCLTFVISDTCDRYDGMISVDSFSMHAKDNYFPMFNNIYDWEMDKHKYMPRQVHVICAVFRSRQVIKNIQQVIDNIKADPSYRDLSEKLLSLVPGSASFNHIASIGLQIS